MSQKAPYFFEKQGVFSRKVGGFLGKGVVFGRLQVVVSVLFFEFLNFIVYHLHLLLFGI